MTREEAVAAIDRYRDVRAKLNAMPLREQNRNLDLRAEASAARQAAVEAREWLRLEDARATKKATEDAGAKWEERLLDRLPEVWWFPPPVWIFDGSYAALSVTAQRCLLPVFAMVRPDGKPFKIDPADVAAAAGCSERTARRGLNELRRNGWIGWKVKEVVNSKEGTYRKVWVYLYPPQGERIPAPPEKDPDSMKAARGDLLAADRARRAMARRLRTAKEKRPAWTPEGPMRYPPRNGKDGADE